MSDAKLPQLGSQFVRGRGCLTLEAIEDTADPDIAVLVFRYDEWMRRETKRWRARRSDGVLLGELLEMRVTGTFVR